VLDGLEERLAGMGEVQVAAAQASESHAWTAFLNKTLSADELKAWNAAQAERVSYRAAALAALLVSEMERRLSLSVEQTDKLDPLLKKAFEDYLPDMGNYLDRNSGMDFRLLSLVILGVPVEQRQAILSPGQEARLQEAAADMAGWWQSIQQAHERRISGKPMPKDPFAP
jgi:hypothetical protein